MCVVEVVSESVDLPGVIETTDVVSDGFDDHSVENGPATGGPSLGGLKVALGEEFRLGN